MTWTHNPSEKSNVKRWAYDAANRELFLVFGSSQQVYRYSEVSPEKFEEFESAPSKGVFFAAQIKPTHECTKVASDEVAS